MGVPTRAAAAAALLLALGPATAGAGSRTLDVEARSGQDRMGAVVASNSAGVTTAVWTGPAPKRGKAPILGSSRAAGRRWSAPKVIARPRAASALVRVDVDDRGVARVLWATPTGKKAEVAIQSAMRSTAGRWSRPATVGVASQSGLLYTAPQGGLGVAADGTATVVWCRGGDSDNVLDQSKPGTVYARTATPDGAWAPPQVLWKGRACADTTVQVNRRGDAFATWSTEQIELAEAQKLFAMRPAGGSWDLAPKVVPEIAGGSVDSTPDVTLSEDGTVRVFAGKTDGVRTLLGLGFATFGRDGRASALEDVPRPAPAQTGGGWVGNGELIAVRHGVDGSGAPTVLFDTAAEPLPNDGESTSAVWSATRTAPGVWRVDPLDDLAEASDPAPDENWSAPELSTGPAGQTYATWTARGSDDPCMTATYRVSRLGSGGWSRRVLLGMQRGAGTTAYCDQRGTVFTAPPPASLLWTTTRRRLAIEPAPASARPGAAPRVRLRTKTWRAVRRAGAIEVGCRAARLGLCHVSLIEASRNADAFEALEGFCRPSQASGTVVRRSREVVLRFPLAKGCYDGGPRPATNATSLQFPVLAVADAVGRESAVTRTVLRIEGR
jgi:hypothetical protein